MGDACSPGHGRASAEHGEEKEMSLLLWLEKGEEGGEDAGRRKDHMGLWFRKATPGPQASAPWGSLLLGKSNREKEGRRAGEGEQSG